MQTQDPNELRYLLTCSLHYAEQKSGVNSYEAATRHLALANLLVNVGDAEAASESIKRSAAILPKLVPAQQTSLSGNMLDLASRLADQDKLQLATFLTDPVAKVTAPNLSAAQQLSSKYVRLSNTFLNRGSAEKAESYAKQAVSLLEKIASPNDPQLAQARLNLASLFEKQNKVGTAIEMHEMALTTPAGDDDTSIKATCSLIGLYAKSGNKAKMNEFSNKLLTALASPSPPNDRQWYPPCAELTGLLIQYGESEAGRKVFAAALNRLSSEPGNSSYEITSATAKLLRQLESAGKIDEAEKIHLMRIAKRNETAVFDDAAISAYSEMCRFYLKHQMDEKAKTTCDTLIEKIRKSQPNPRMLSSLCSLANSFISHQRYPGALPVALLAVELANANQTKDSQTIEAYTRAAIAYNGMGDTANAKLMLLKGVSLITPRLAPEFSTVGSSWEKLVAAQVDAGKVDESANLLSLVGAQALSSRQRTPSNSYALNTYRSLGTAADSAKVPDLACIYFKRALDIEGESSGPCSLQSANIMRSYSNSLRNAGKIKEAQSFEDAAVVIRDQYVRHIRGERNVYNPHRSLEELLKDAHLKKYRPDSST